MKKQNKIITTLIILSFTTSMYSSSSLQKISQKSLIRLVKVLSRNQSSSKIQNNALYQKELLQEISNVFLEINANFEYRNTFQRALAENNPHVATVILDMYTLNHANENHLDKINKIKQLAHEFNCIESAKII